ncbi:MAG TPA: hypothetical protein VMN36_13285 [Verrucomicrobiales bacterium]|nr:hypothetical protein [Verrucomicrobiales bacterium]
MTTHIREEVLSREALAPGAARETVLRDFNEEGRRREPRGFRPAVHVLCYDVSVGETALTGAAPPAPTTAQR